MLIERIYDEDLAQASYLIGCQAKGEALVVDPRRDIEVYQDARGRQRHEDRRRHRDPHPRRLPLRHP